MYQWKEIAYSTRKFKKISLQILATEIRIKNITQFVKKSLGIIMAKFSNKDCVYNLAKKSLLGLNQSKLV